MAEEKLLDYKTYMTTQKEIVDFMNETLPKIKDFPVSYVWAEGLPNVESYSDAMSIAFPPTALVYRTDFGGRFAKMSFMVYWRQTVNSSEDKLSAIKVLQYLYSEIDKLKITLGSDKIVLGFSPTMSPSVQEIDDKNKTATYVSIFELDYKIKNKR